MRPHGFALENNDMEHDRAIGLIEPSRAVLQVAAVNH